jgi:hypothetical protein
MKKTATCFLLIIATFFMTGCEKSGYIIIITMNSKHIRYDDLQQIGRMLEEKGFRALVWEGKEDKEKYPNEVYTLFEKRLADKHFYTIDVNLHYIKDVPNNIAYNLGIQVHNVYKGMAIKDLRDEINRIGDLVYLELAAKVGKENVIIERKETPQRVIFF